MNTYSNILDFIEKKNMSIRAFEAKAGLSNGTINAAKTNKELSAENVNKIVEHFSTDLSEFGYLVLDLMPLGKSEKVILTVEQRNQLAHGFDLPVPEKQNLREEIHYEELLRQRIKDKQEVIDEKEARLRELEEHKRDWREQNKELLGIMKAQLNTLAGSVSLAHKEILTEIKASMRWEARRLAAGNKQKEIELLAELGTIVGAVRDEFWPGGNVEVGNI